MKSENDSFVSQKDGTVIETQECKYDEDLKDVSKSLDDKSAKYADASSILNYAVSSIVKCEVILLASNYDDYTGPLLCKLRSIKDELGIIIDDLVKNRLDENKLDNLKSEEKPLKEMIDSEAKDFSDYKLETSDFEFDIEQEQSKVKELIPTRNRKGNKVKEKGKVSDYDDDYSEDICCCSGCGGSFNSFKELEGHSRLCVSSNQYSCDLCEKLFPTKYGLNCHVGRKHPNAHFICDICGSIFTNRKEFKAHKHNYKSEAENLILPCYYCDKKFQSQGAYKLHLKNLHIKFHSCSECREAFSESKDLIQHVKENHDGKIYSCKFCEKEFASANSLQRHVPEHGSHQCPSCGKKYTEAKSLKMHIKSHHSQKFECSTCGAAFDRKVDLSKHETDDHLLPRKVCQICGYSTNNSSSFASHLKIHGPKLYKCEVCGTSFAKNSYLKTHARIHTGEKPYICQVCGSTFRKSSLLARHRIIHTGNKPFECTICGKGFNQKGNLKTHMKSHSSDKQF